MPEERRWSDADRSVAGDAIDRWLTGLGWPDPTALRPYGAAAAVLDALTAAGWRGPADCIALDPVCTATAAAQYILQCTYWSGPRHFCKLDPDHTGDHLCQCGVAFARKGGTDG